MTNGAPDGDRDDSPERVGLVWIGTERAVLVRWDDEPVVEHVASSVTPRRRAVGSVRRGPARPEGGGRVPGHGTKTKHEEELRQFLEDIASRLAGLETIEVGGRGALPERFAELIRAHAATPDAAPDVTTRVLSRRPSDAQLKARLRKLADRELPRKRVGRYRLPPSEPTTPTGRPLRPAAGRRTLRPERAPEHREIAEELELLQAETETGEQATDRESETGSGSAP